MGVTRVTRLMSPEEIAVRAGEQVAFVRLPDRASVFADRELRLRQLAAGHAMSDYLRFMATLAQAQQAQLQQMPALATPDAAQIDAAAVAGLPPLPAEAGPSDPAWRSVLRSLLARLEPLLSGSPALTVVQQLSRADDEHLEHQAQRLLNGVTLGLDLGAAPLIAAALQLCWTHQVLEVQRLHGAAREEPFGRIDDATACPCCGSRPTASITRIGADESGYRYLHCSLCSAQWHMVRIKCTHCESTKGIHFHGLEALPGHAAPATAASPGAVQAETCDVCHHYLKVVHMEKDPHVEPIADDLATVTLDLLVSEEGFARHGVNLMLLFGDPEPEPPPEPPPNAPGP
jgi:FdhE protein